MVVQIYNIALGDLSVLLSDVVCTHIICVWYEIC